MLTVLVITHRPDDTGGAGDQEGDVMNDMGTRLSTLWVVVMFNMVFADILTFITPGALQALWAGQTGVRITPELLLVFAILLEIPIAMILASRLLKPGANRWANTVAAVVTTAFVVGGGSLTPHYVFFAAVEIACVALIVWSAWSRRDSARAWRREPASSVTSGAQPRTEG
jgi:Sec-independent protein secretion pathway component TatC